MGKSEIVFEPVIVAFCCHYCAFTAAFRREAGSYGKDVRGILRLHQRFLDRINEIEMNRDTDHLHGCLAIRHGRIKQYGRSIRKHRMRISFHLHLRNQ